MKVPTQACGVEMCWRPLDGAEAQAMLEGLAQGQTRDRVGLVCIVKVPAKVPGAFHCQTNQGRGLSCVCPIVVQNRTGFSFDLPKHQGLLLSLINPIPDPWKNIPKSLSSPPRRAFLFGVQQPPFVCPKRTSAAEINSPRATRGAAYTLAV